MLTMEPDVSAVARRWSGRTMALLGGGPSLASVDISALQGAGWRVMAINSAARFAPAADVLFFGDDSWFAANADLVAGWQGLCYTLSPRAKREMPHRVALLQGVRSPWLSRDPRWTCRGRSAGHTAINLAAQLGARRVVLLGYDCRTVEGRSHFHDEYSEPETVYRDDFLPAWQGWAVKTANIGLEVVNATEGSALDEFPRRSLKELLAA